MREFILMKILTSLLWLRRMTKQTFFVSPWRLHQKLKACYFEFLRYSLGKTYKDLRSQWKT